MEVIPRIETNFKNNPGDREKEIIEMYLEMRNGWLYNSATAVKRKYRLSQVELNTIVITYSVNFLKLGVCEYCDESVVYEIKTQSEIKKRIDSEFIICKACNKELEDRLDGYKDFVQKFNIKMEYAIKSKNWRKLNKSELGFLRVIVKLNDYQELYHSYIKKDINYYDKIISRLEKFCLIRVDYKGFKYVINSDSERYEHVVEKIFFLPKIAAYLDMELRNRIFQENGLSIDLDKFKGKGRVNERDYVKRIVFSRDIQIDKGKEFICSIWENPDGTLRFELEELNKLK